MPPRSAGFDAENRLYLFALTLPRSEVGRAHSVRINIANAEAFAERVRPILAELSELSARAAAQELDRRGYATARGGKWSATLVIRTRARLEASP